MTPGQSETVHFEKERGVTEIQVTQGVAHAFVELPTATLAREQLGLLQSLATAGIPVFLIKLHPTGVSFALRYGQVESGASHLAALGFPHTLLRELAHISVIAGAMRDLSGVMASIYEAFVEAKVSVRQTGDAHNAVLCLVDGDKSDLAAAALRKIFALSEPPEDGTS